MSIGMKVLVHAKHAMENYTGASYDTVAEWLKEGTPEEVSKELYDFAKDKMEQYMEGDYEFFYDYDDVDHSGDILGCGDPDRLVKEAEEWDESIRGAFARDMDRFFKTMTDSGFDSMQDFLRYAENTPDLKVDDVYSFDSAVYNLRKSSGTYADCINYGSYLAVINGCEDVGTKVGADLEDIRENPGNWALINIAYN